MHVNDAVNSPRVHWENNVFNIEPGFSEEAIKAVLDDNNQLVYGRKEYVLVGFHTVMEIPKES